MIFDLPVKIIEDEDCVIKNSKELAKLGKKALVVTGRSSAKKCGAYDDVCEALTKEGIAFELFDEIEENPSVETIVKARDRYKDAGIKFVIGIGGGSPMDAAKAIAVLLCYLEEDGEFLYTAVPNGKTLPVVEIPTTCGTGSEVTKVSVLTRHNKKTKASIAHRYYPVLALMDSKYLSKAPMSIITNTAIDALAHLVESDLNTNTTFFSRTVGADGYRLIAKEKDVLTGKRAPEAEDFRNLMNASLFAGISIAHAGTSLPHSLGYKLTYELGVPHGPACAYFLTAYMKEVEKEESARILELLGIADLDEFEAFLQAACLKGAKYDEAILRESAEDVMANTAKLKNTPFTVTKEVLYRISGI